MADQLYDGFISYSHAADGLLAPRLQAGLQRFAKPWWKRRAVRIFRDESSLSANPHLWSSITGALDSSGWFVLLLSPDAASSEWVNQEIAYWKTNRDPSRILPVVTDGEFGWVGGDVIGEAIPEQLRGVFAAEPRWVDLRFARDEEQLDLKNPRFSAAVADIASALRGVPKDELESEEVRQHRRTIRTAWAAGGLVTVLAIAAIGFGIQSTRNADEADRQAALAEQNAGEAQSNAEEAESERERATNEAARAEENAELASTNARLARARELAASAIARLDSDPELATLLALAAIDATPEGLEQPVEVINALWRAGQSNRLVDSIDTGFTGPVPISLSHHGQRLAVASEDAATLQMYDAHTLELIWAYSEETVDSFSFSDISVDGRVAVSVLDSSASAAVREVGGDDDLPARIVILDGADGSLIHSIELSDCASADLPVWSPNGDLLVVTSGFEGCERAGSRHWFEVYDTESWESVVLLPAGDAVSVAPAVRFDDTGNVFLLAAFAPAVAYDLETLEALDLPGWSGIGDITRDGQIMVAAYPQEQVGLALNVYRRDSADRTDLLTPMPGQVPVPEGVSISDDGRYAFAITQARDVMVFDLGTREVAFRLPAGAATNTEFDVERQIAFTAHFDGTVKVWDLSTETTGIDIVEDLGAASWINGNSISIGEELGSAVAIDTSLDEWFIRFFDLETGAFMSSVPARGATPLPGGRWSLLSADGVLRILEPGTGETTVVGGCVSNDGFRTCADTGEPYPHDQILVSVDSEEVLLLRGSTDGFESGQVQPLDPVTGDLGRAEELIGTRFREIVAFSDEWILGRSTASIVANDRETGEVLFERTALPDIEIAASGRRAAFIDPETGVVVVEFDEWVTTDIPVDFNRIRGMAFSADETRLMLTGIDRLYVIDVNQRAVAQVLEISGGSDAHWLSDDRFLIGTTDGIWGIGSLSTEDFLRSTRDGLRRSFTEAECALYRIDPCPTLEKLKVG